MLDRRRFSIAAAAATTLGVRPARAAVDFLRVNDAVALGSRTGGSGTIWFGGEAIAAWGDQYTRYALESSTKTIGALLLGVAIKRKGMALETLARAYLPHSAIRRPRTRLRGGQSRSQFGISRSTRPASARRAATNHCCSDPGAPGATAIAGRTGSPMS